MPLISAKHLIVDPEVYDYHYDMIIHPTKYSDSSRQTLMDFLIVHQNSYPGLICYGNLTIMANGLNKKDIIYWHLFTSAAEYELYTAQALEKYSNLFEDTRQYREEHNILSKYEIDIYSGSEVEQISTSFGNKFCVMQQLKSLYGLFIADEMRFFPEQFTNQARSEFHAFEAFVNNLPGITHILITRSDATTMQTTYAMDNEESAQALVSALQSRSGLIRYSPNFTESTSIIPPSI